jgi:hypothetical protein
MQAALKRLPLNHLGLPDSIYRPDLLPSEIPVQASDDELRHLFSYAASSISYSEGFPTQENGLPFWSQLPFEPPDSFKDFESYIRLGRISYDQMPRDMYADPNEEDPRATGTRQLHLLETDDHPLSALRESFTYYYWPYRAKAYDLYKAAAGQRTRELLAIELQNDHLRKANGMMDKLFTEVFDNEEFWETITPATAIKFMVALAQWARVSLGLPASGPPALPRNLDPQDIIRPGSSMELIFRQLARADLPLGQSGQSGLGGVIGQSYEQRAMNTLERLRKTLSNDPQAASYAQELIIRMTTPESMQIEQSKGTTIDHATAMKVT